MSIPPPHRPAPATPWLAPLSPPVRTALLLALAVAELLWLSVRFDTSALSASESWLTRLAGDLPVYLRIGLAALAAFLVIAYPRLPAMAREGLRAAESHRWLAWLPLHLAAYAWFFDTTTTVFSLAAAAAVPSTGILTGWLLLGLAVAMLWLVMVAPLGFWRQLLQREPVALGAALVAGVAAWGLGELAHEFWKPLAEGTFLLARQLLGVAYPDVLFDTEDYSLGTPDFMVRVAPECSGYEGIALVIVFLALYCWIFRDSLRFPHSLLLFPIGALAIWLANVVRISTLIAIGTSFSREVALGGFHSQAGWIAFSAIALGMIVLTRKFGLFAREPAANPAHRDTAVGEPESQASALLVPLIVLMAALMVTQAASHGFDWLYPLRPVLTAAALWRYRRVYRQWDWSWSWTGPAVGLLVFVLWMALEPPGDDSVLGNALNDLSPAARAAWLAFRVVGSVVLVPLVEELAFRGYLLRRLVSPEFESVPYRFHWLAFLGSSLAFGLVHGRWLAGGLAGMAYALAVYRRGKLGDAIVAHMVTNGLIALTAVAWGRWSLWS